MGLMQMFVQLGLNATAYHTGLKQAQGAAENFGNKITSQLGNRLAGLFTLGAIEEAFRRTVVWGTSMVDFSNRTGIAIDDIQKFDYAAGQTGSSIEKITKSWERLDIAMAKARTGDEDAMKGLKGLGLSEQQVHLLDTAEALRTIGDVVKEAGGATGAFRKNMKEIMGKESVDLIKVFREDIRGMGDDLERMGLVVPAETMQQLDDLEDFFHTLGIANKAFFAEMLSFGGDALNSIADGIAGVGLGFQEVFAFIKENGGNIKISETGGLFSAFGRGLNAPGEARAEKELREMRERTEAWEKTQQALRQIRIEEESTEKNLKQMEVREKDDAKKIEEAVKIHEKLEQIKRRTAMGELTDAARLREINEEIYEAKLDVEAGKGIGGASMQLDQAKAELRLAELEEEKGKLERKLDRDKTDKDKGKDLTLKPETNALVSIGNILGVDPNRPIVDKLEVVHLDLVRLINKVSGESPLSQADSEFPT